MQPLGVVVQHPTAQSVTFSLRLDPARTQVRVFFADYTQVESGRDGVRIIFGKLNSFNPNKLHQALEVSFPFRRFYNQLFHSITSVRERQNGRSFRDEVADSVEMQGLERITELPAVTEAERLTSMRANFTVVAMFEDDTALDLVHLDAASLNAIAKKNSMENIDLGGLTRVVMSPSLLLYFMDKVIPLAGRLRDMFPNIEEPPSE